MEIFSPDKMKEFYNNSEPLLSASLRVTKGCNLRCRHCYASAGTCLKNELKTQEIKDVITSISNLGSFSIFFTGGEPFLRSDITDIFKYASNLGLSIYTSTNGSLVTKEKLNEIKRLDIKLFQVSLDSVNPNTHDNLIRGTKDTHKKAVNAIEMASKILKTNVAVGTVLMKYNYRELGEILKFANGLGADTFALILLLKYGRADGRLDATIAQKLEAIKYLFDAYEDVGETIKFANNTTLPIPLIPKDLREKLWDKFCFCSFPYLVGVESNGDVAPCDGFLGFKETIIGNTRKTPLEKMWNESKLIKSLKSIKPSDLKGVCGKCKYNEYCMGGCRASAYLEYKDFKMPDPLCQKLYELKLFPQDCLKG